MSSYKIIYTTITNLTEAQNLANKVVKAKLAACANIIPGVLSVYEWEGEVKNDAECVVIFKTRVGQVDDLEMFIKSEHPYEVPAILGIDLSSVDADYREWLDAQTSVSS